MSRALSASRSVNSPPHLCVEADVERIAPKQQSLRQSPAHRRAKFTYTDGELALSFQRCLTHHSPNDQRDTNPSTPHEVALGKQRAQAVHRFIDRLPERWRQVVLGRFFRGESCREIADRLDVSPPRITAIMRKVMARGQEELACLAT